MASNSTPKSHPKGNGLEGAIRDGVQSELDRRGMGNGGGDDRLARLEREVAVIKETMATQKHLDAEVAKLQRDSADIKVELARMPFKIVTWLLTAIGAISGIIFTVYRIASAA